MDIHEFQAKQLLRHYGIPSTEFAVLSKGDDADACAEALGLEQAVLKVQVHAGGRGKAGGVKIARSRREIHDFAGQLIGMKIVNNQTGSKGIVARQVLLTGLVAIKRELYMGAVIDRKRGKAVLIVSPQGGMEIEAIAEANPEKIMTLPITSDGAIRPYNLLNLVNFMGWKGALAEKGKALALALANAFVDTDASLIEINPLVETEQGDLIALDAKMSIDDNALFRQPAIAECYDPSQSTPEEVRARAHDLAYIALDGDIGCMVNGAGLAMATMDIIHHWGGSPANFLDVGGGASADKIAEGFKLIISDKKVKAVLVNIFGGIMNCETLAAGILAGAAEQRVQVPLVVRMEGTNVEQGRKMLEQSDLKITIANSLTEAAKKAVEAAKG